MCILYTDEFVKSNTHLGPHLYKTRGLTYMFYLFLYRWSTLCATMLCLVIYHNVNIHMLLFYFSWIRASFCVKTTNGASIPSFIITKSCRFQALTLITLYIMTQCGLLHNQENNHVFILTGRWRFSYTFGASFGQETGPLMVVSLQFFHQTDL